jgi:hypothetical protein
MRFQFGLWLCLLREPTKKTFYEIPSPLAVLLARKFHSKKFSSVGRMMLVKAFVFVVFALVSVLAQRTDYPVLGMWINQQGSRVGSLDPFDGTYYFNHVFFCTYLIG